MLLHRNTLSLSRSFCCCEPLIKQTRLTLIPLFGSLSLRPRLFFQMPRCQPHPLLLPTAMQCYPLLPPPHLFFPLPRLLLRLLPYLLLFLPQFSHFFLLRFLQLDLVPFRLFSELLVDCHSSDGVCDIFVFVHELTLDLEYNQLVVHDALNHVVSGLLGVVMMGHLSAFIKGQLEKIGMTRMMFFRLQTRLSTNSRNTLSKVDPAPNPGLCRDWLFVGGL